MTHVAGKYGLVPIRSGEPRRRVQNGTVERPVWWPLNASSAGSTEE